MRAVAAAKLTVQYCSGKVVAQRQASGGGVRVCTLEWAQLSFSKREAGKGKTHWIWSWTNEPVV